MPERQEYYEVNVWPYSPEMYLYKDESKIGERTRNGYYDNNRNMDHNMGF